MSTNSEASSRAKWSTPLSIFIPITWLGKDYVTFVKSFEASCASLQLWPWICKALIFSFSVDLCFKCETENSLETLCLTGPSLDWAPQNWGLQEYLMVLTCFSIFHNLLDEQFCLIIVKSLRYLVKIKNQHRMFCIFIFIINICSSVASKIYFGMNFWVDFFSSTSFIDMLVSGVCIMPFNYLLIVPSVRISPYFISI